MGITSPELKFLASKKVFHVARATRGPDGFGVVVWRSTLGPKHSTGDPLVTRDGVPRVFKRLDAVYKWACQHQIIELVTDVDVKPINGELRDGQRVLDIKPRSKK
jgi:hypothetical protein